MPAEVGDELAASGQVAEAVAGVRLPHRLVLGVQHEDGALHGGPARRAGQQVGPPAVALDLDDPALGARGRGGLRRHAAAAQRRDLRRGPGGRRRGAGGQQPEEQEHEQAGAHPSSVRAVDGPRGLCTQPGRPVSVPSLAP